MILLIDNYDSFVHNLARYLRELLRDRGLAVEVVRNDAVTVAQVADLAPRAIVISPGPCTPREAGICLELVRELSPAVPLLGVCLGHQAIAAALGGRVVRAPQPVHGQVSEIEHDGSGLFAGLPNPLKATRYHSLVVDPASLDDRWQVTARTGDGLVMAIAHRHRPAWGVQFHPESILTESGHRLLWNFLAAAGVVDGELPAGISPVVPGGLRHQRTGFADPGAPETTPVVLHW